ncbi:MAG: protein kinase domain-containing protein [Planctomycetota bacterium]|jgi:tRNA A-37 threonylcarbamoyl transferase component Bud32
MAEERHCTECGRKLTADAPQGLCPQCLIKIGLPSGAEVDKAATSDNRSDVFADGTPPAGFVPPEPSELAKQFPQLEILELLGQGGMGAVYKARQKQLDRLVALKILPPEVGRTEAFAERFVREAQSLAKLNHPRIVSVYDFGHTKAGLYYFIMEFVDGTDLRRVIHASELTAAEALAIIPQVCEALQYAHEEGIVHRDIKPENILLNKKGRVKIADFGLAKLLDRPATAYTLTKDGQKMGTPHYMAPEQIEHPTEVDHRADIYSLGVVFYEMLTGELPLGRFAPPSEKVQIDVRLDNVVLRTLEKEPERRYQHASEVKTDVEAVCASPKPSVGRAKYTTATAPEINIEDIRAQVRVPAIGLIIAGAINCVGLFFIALSFGYYFLAQEGSGIPGIFGILIVAAGALPGIMTIMGGVNMLKVRSYSLSVTGAIIALLPFAPGFIVGLPFGIWSLVVLFRPDVRAAFARARGAARSKPMSAKGKILVFCAIAFVILATIIPIVLPILWSIIAAERVASQPQSVETYTPYGVESLETIPTRIGDLDLPYGTPDDITFGQEGPTLSDECTRTLELEPSEAVQVHKILRRAYRQYLELERQNTQQYRKVNSLTVIISPFRQEAESFLKQFWTDLDSILDEQKRTLARRHLPLGQMFGTFQFGGPKVTISISKENGRFSYYTTYKWQEGSGKSGKGTSSGGGSTLPPEYDRFWQEAPSGKKPRSTGI